MKIIYCSHSDTFGKDKFDLYQIQSVLIVSALDVTFVEMLWCEIQMDATHLF